MECEMCGRKNAESVGMHCGKYKVCNTCVSKSIHTRMWVLGKPTKHTDYLYGVEYKVSRDDGENESVIE